MTHRKKLIEVALPLEAINIASAREKSIRHGHPSTLHLWWARRPLAAARAVIFAQMVDDPSAHPDLFPTAKAQEKERQRLFRIIEELVKWENTTNETVLQQARDEIWQSWRYTCAENADHPRAAELFDRYHLPAFHDPFAGGGALPLEAQRLGLESYASDLNPVAVLINKAMIEIPPKFAGKPPVNPGSAPGSAGIPAGKDREPSGRAPRAPRLLPQTWRGAQGLAEDVRYYGQWMRDEAEKRIGHLYPKIEVTAVMAEERPDLKSYVGQQLTVIAWLWARTVKSPNPAFAHVDVPLASTFMLSTKAGKEAWVEPVIEGDSYRFTVRAAGSAPRGLPIPAGKDAGAPRPPASAKNGTKLSRGANFSCLMSGIPIEGDYIKAEGKAKRMGARLMAIVAEGDRGRIYLPPTLETEAVALEAKPEWRPAGDVPARLTGGTCYGYGLTEWGDLFTPRQLVALTTFSDLVQEARTRAQQDAVAAGLPADGKPLAAGGTGATAYADAVTVYLGIALSRLTDICNALCRWENTRMQVRNLFGRQAIPMLWDFAENNVFGEAAGDYLVSLSNMVHALEKLPSQGLGIVRHYEAQNQLESIDKIISTDPPYCLAPGTLIQTDAGYVPIERIQVGDRVLSHSGRFAGVTRIYQRPYRGLLYRIKVAHSSQPLLITGEHPIFGIRSGGCAVGYADYCHVRCAWMAQNDNHCSKRLADGYQLAWIPAGEVKVNDLIFMPTFLGTEATTSFQISQNLSSTAYMTDGEQLHYQKATPISLAWREKANAAPRRYVLADQLPLTPELCRLIGYFVAEGYANVNADRGAVHFTLHCKEQALAADIEALMQMCFGLKAGKRTDNRKQNNQSIRLNFYSKPIAELLRQWCYTSEGFKRLPVWVLGLPEANLIELVRSYWWGDGYRANRNYIASTNSPYLAGQLRLLLQRLGVTARLHTRIIKPTQINGMAVIARGPQYSLHVNGPSLVRMSQVVGQPKDHELTLRRNGQHGAWWEGGYLLPIRAVEPVEYDGIVYNLATEDHSYVTAAGCVHNCDNIGYADLSDFFYVWLRRTLRSIFPDLFSTLAVPKAEELVSTPYRHGSKLEAEAFFIIGMTKAMTRLAEQSHPAYPVTIYYAYKQQETYVAAGAVSTGWEGFLESVIQAGFAISGTWPIRTELGNRMIGQDTNALASSIVLVCRKRPSDAPTATRRDFISALQAELPAALILLQRGNIAPVDLAQAAIGPGMAVYTRYAKVLDAEGKPLPVRAALALINQTLDEALAEQEGDFDADSRWAVAWSEQHGFAEGDYGVAETLSKAKNTSVAGMVAAGILTSSRGKVRLLRPDELPADWDPTTDKRLSAWEAVHQLVRALEAGGDRPAAALVTKLGSQAEAARELCYRLYTVSERKKRAADALSYNGLVQSWPEITRLAREGGSPPTQQPALFVEDEE